MKIQNVLLVMLMILSGFVAMTSGQNKFVAGISQKDDKPLKIKKKPVSEVRSTSCSEESGIVSVRVTFDKSAKVTAVETVKSSGCAEFDENAVKAAQKITFEPAIKDGEPITVDKIVQYSFRKY